MQVSDQVSVGVVDLGHEGEWQIVLGLGWWISLVCWGGEVKIAFIITRKEIM